VGIALFVSVLFLATTEALIRSKIVPNHPFYRYLELFKNAQTPNAIFGDSHFAYGIIGLDGFVNLAYPGNNFEAIVEKVRLYFSDKPPGRIILQAGVHHFSQNFLFRRPNESRSIKEDLKPRRFTDLFLLHNQHRNHLFGYWEVYLSGREFTPKTQFVTEELRGNEPNYMEIPAETRRVASARIARILQPVSTFRETHVARLYEDVVKFLKQHGGDVCLVTLPVVVELRNEIGATPLFANVTKYFEEIAAKHRATYRNFLTTPMDENYFSDPHHLNITGARAVSSQVAQSCFGKPGAAHTK